ncbi:MAG: tRNA (adenosine(37)-N6)-threonylcarbamoyltransferase complex ATPase subunit type 1 TsaE [Pirellulales bacterium]
MCSANDSSRLAVTIPHESALSGIARLLVMHLPSHACVALHGDLGAGKTTFVKNIASAIGIEHRNIVSPTFGLIHIHDALALDAPIRLIHADFYRLSGLDELREVGWDDAISACSSTRVWAFVEWPERIANALPEDRLQIFIDITSETTRTLLFRCSGTSYLPCMHALRTFVTHEESQTKQV